MKNREFATIGRKLLPHLPGFVVKGPMTFKSPIGDILYALHFDGSDFDAESFYVEIFFCRSTFQRNVSTSITENALAGDATCWRLMIRISWLRLFKR